MYVMVIFYLFLYGIILILFMFYLLESKQMSKNFTFSYEIFFYKSIILLSY